MAYVTIKYPRIKLAIKKLLAENYKTIPESN